MKRFSILFALSAAGLAALAAGAQAGQTRYGSHPPLLLSPNLTEPWLMQLQPRPRARRETRRQPIMPRDDRRRTGMREHWQPAWQPTINRAPVREAALQARPHVAAPTRRRDIAPEFLPTVISYDGPQKPGTIVIDTDARYLYLVERGGKARRYGVGVGRPGFSWAGTHKITRKAEWPRWTPPAEMRQRQPGLPKYMEGGPNNPLGARALYLGSTLYRIHGSNQPWTIGHAVSSGCIRMRNQDVTDLYQRVGIGTKVIVR